MVWGNNMWKISSLASDQIACHHWNGGEVQVSWRSEGQDTEEISLGVSGHHHRASRENLQLSPHRPAENRCSEHLYDDQGLLPPQCLDCRQMLVSEDWRKCLESSEEVNDVAKEDGEHAVFCIPRRGMHGGPELISMEDLLDINRVNRVQWWDA